MEEIAVLFEGEAVERMISRMAHEIIEHSESLDRMLLVGIERGGVPLAGRLQAQILRYTGKEDSVPGRPRKAAGKAYRRISPT